MTYSYGLLNIGQIIGSIIFLCGCIHLYYWFGTMLLVNMRTIEQLQILPETYNPIEIKIDYI